MMIRYLKFERKLPSGKVIRVYEAEAPDPEREEDGYDYFLSGTGEHPRLIELELRLSKQAAEYFPHYALADAIWKLGLRPFCFRPFCCCEFWVLYYPLEPQVRSITDMDRWRDGPIVLEVRLEGEPDWNGPDVEFLSS